MYSALMDQSKALLKPHHSHLYFEVHENYANEVQELCNEYGFTSEIITDLAGKNRFVIGSYNPSITWDKLAGHLAKSYSSLSALNYSLA